MAGAGDEQGIEVALDDDPVQVDVDEVESGRRSPVPEQARLDVLRAEGLAQQRIGKQVDLPDRQVVRGTPVRVDARQQLAAQGLSYYTRRLCRRHESMMTHRANSIDRLPSARMWR